MNFSKLKIGDIIYSIKSRFAERADSAERADIAAEAEKVKGVNVEGYVQNSYYSARSGIANTAEYVEGSNVDGSVTHAYLSDLAGEAEKVDGINVVGAVGSAVNAQKSTTQAKTDNSDNIATTEYVQNNLADYLPKNADSNVVDVVLSDTEAITWGSVKSFKYVKVGNIVQIMINTNGSFNNVSTAQTIATLPSGYRPKAAFQQNYNTQDGRAMLLAVQTNGDIRLYNTSGSDIANTWICRQTFTFIV